MNRDRAWGIAGEGKSSFVERSVAKFRRTSGASNHVRPQKASTSISAIRHVEMCGKSIRGVNPGRISLERVSTQEIMMILEELKRQKIANEDMEVTIL